MGTDAAVIAALADGSLGRAYDLAAAGLGGRDDALALLTALPTLCAEDIWKHAEAFGALSGEERAARLDFFRMGLRDLLVLTEDGAAPIFHADRRDRLAALLPQMTRPRLFALLHAESVFSRRLGANVNPSLQAEAFLLRARNQFI